MNTQKKNRSSNTIKGESNKGIYEKKLETNNQIFFKKNNVAVNNDKRFQKEISASFNRGVGDEKISITAIGGLGQVGGNMTVIESKRDAIIVDIGISFPQEGIYGIDIAIPDFSYIDKIKDKVRGIIITHSHEDHIGAVAWLFRKVQFPVYGTPLSIALISNKLNEHRLGAYRSYLKPIKKRTFVKVGEFSVEWIHITHSIIDASSIAIKTRAGNIVHTGDFKIDNTPIDNRPTDLHRLAHYGEEGVLCLLSDSTNSLKSGFTGSESIVGKAFERIFSTSKNRIIISTFSSNMHRVYQAIQYATYTKRKVCILGKSLENNLRAVLENGYIKINKHVFIRPENLDEYKDEEILIIVTGSQGEKRSTLCRMATGEHKQVKIQANDLIILSSKTIPGNEISVSNMLNLIVGAKASIYHDNIGDLHVSGHASQEEQKLMIRLTKPKFFLPIHGEHIHLNRHRKTAIECGIPKKNIITMRDGDQIELTQKHMVKTKHMKINKVFIDSQSEEQLDKHTATLREILSNSGVISISIQTDNKFTKMLRKPSISNCAVVPSQKFKSLSRDMESELKNFFSISNLDNGYPKSKKSIEEKLRKLIKKYLFKKIRKYPIIMLTLFC